MAIRATVGGGCEEPILEVLREWERLGVSPVAGAAWLQSLRLAVSRTSAPDFVWTGPEVAGLHARDTRRVYEELLGTAERSIWASTYAFFDGPQAFKMLASRMDAVPGLEVTLLLNIDRKRGDTTVAETLVRRFADEFWHREWPGAVRPKVYYDPRSNASMTQRIRPTLFALGTASTLFSLLMIGLFLVVYTVLARRTR